MTDILTPLADYIKEKAPTIPMSHIHLSIYMCVSDFLCFNRVKVKVHEERHIFPNLYSATFMKSGAGKNRAVDEAKRVIPFFIDGRKDIINKIYNSNIYKIKNCEEYKKLQERQKDKYLDRHSPRRIVCQTDNITIEGLQSMRETLQEESIGNVNFLNDEFGKYISTNMDASATLNFLNKIYDGNNEAKVIKGSKDCKEVTGVPQTMFGLSAPKGLISDDKATSTFKDFLDTGLARRMFICYPAKKEFHPPIDRSEDMEFDERMNNKAKELRELFKDKEKIFTSYKVKNNFNYTPDKTLNDAKDVFNSDDINIEFNNITIEFTPEALKLYKKYLHKCEKLSFSLDNEFSSEIGHRPDKMIRLAAILTFLLSDSPVISPEILSNAIDITEGYGKQFARFYNTIDASTAEKLYDYIKEKGNITRTKALKDSGIPKKFQDDKYSSDNLLSVVETMCIDNNERLVFKSIGTGGRYSIEKLPEHIEPKEPILITMSQAPTNSTKPEGYKEITLPFSEIHTIITGNRAYSASPFKKEYREGKNWIEDQLLIIDIDNEVEENEQLTIVQAREKLKKFKYLIAETRHHGIEKSTSKESKPPRDRFRVIIPLSKSIKDISHEEYQGLKLMIMDYLELEDKIIDKGAFKDKAKLYFAHGGNYEYNDGKLFNIDVVIEQQNNMCTGAKNDLYSSWKTIKQSVSKYSSIKSNRNINPNQQFGTKQGNRSVGWDHYSSCRPDEKQVTHCRDHKDGSASAFVSRSEHIDSLYSYCSSCGTTVWEK